MTSLALVIQDHKPGPGVLFGCRNFVSGVQFDRLTGLYAFASYKGAKLLIELLSSAVANWQSVAKRWVVSIDGAITEPEALTFLLSQRRTEVRVPDSEELLQRKFVPRHRFHPKTLLLERTRAALDPVGLLVGSANLTLSGLCFGHEHLLAATFSSPAKLSGELMQGIVRLEASVQSATPIDEAFVDRYRKLRPEKTKILAQLEDDRAEKLLQPNPVIPSIVSATLAAAENLWIEVKYVVPNRGPNEEGNQIDLQRGTRVFFGFSDKSLPKNSPIGTVRIVYAHHSAMRNLRFGNNMMDKLDLPVPGQDGPSSYSGETLLFAKLPNGAFELTVGDSTQVASWKSSSQRLGTRYAMRGGREFGVF